MIQEAIDTAVKGVDERANKTSADLKASSKAVDTLTASLSAFPGQVKAMLAAATKDLATKAEYVYVCLIRVYFTHALLAMLL